MADRRRPGLGYRLTLAGVMSALCVAALLAAPRWSAAQDDEAVTVTSDTHEIRLIRVAMTDSLNSGMVQPPSAEEAFLLVYLETDDPCFDPARNRDCFDGGMDELETIAWACGAVEIAPDNLRPADGGGLLDGELACSYVIPRDTGGLILRLRGYEAIDVEPKG